MATKPKVDLEEEDLENGKRYEIDFFSGHIDVCLPGKFTKGDDTIEYGNKIDLSKVVDKKGRILPHVFMNMITAFMADQEAVKLTLTMCPPGKFDSSKIKA